MMTAPRLSKSRIQSGRQCHKRLWLELNNPAAAQWGDAAQTRLDEGTRFGELARDLLGGGTLIAADYMHAVEAMAQTHTALEGSRGGAVRLFEPAFEFEGVRVRVDALEVDSNGDTLIEVKSTTSVKDEHVWDCAIQMWVARGAGRPVRRILHAHVDREFVYSKPGDYLGLLKLADITEAVEKLQSQIPPLVAQLTQVATGPQPALSTGDHCTTPYVCPFLDHCQAGEPPSAEFPIDVLPRGGTIVNELRLGGYRDIRDVPDELLKREMHKRVAAATRDNTPYVSGDFAAALAAIPYPRFYLDFETISFVIPRWLGTRPYQQVPFQFSCHIETAPSEFRHESFLDLSGESPLASFTECLIAVLGAEGPVLVWNRGFEGGRLRELAECIPEKKADLLAIMDRMVDLLPIYRDHYYHRDMRGSWSIKSVLPTVAPELDYSNLEVNNGSAAQAAYLEAISTQTPIARREEIRSHLTAYCERDTYAMTRLMAPPLAPT